MENKDFMRKLICIEKKLCTLASSNGDTLLQSIINELQELTTSDVNEHHELPDPTDEVFVNFKYLSFVAEGSIQVTIDGNTVTYPYTLGTTTINGFEIPCNGVCTNSVTFNGTGTVLVNVIY